MSLYRMAAKRLQAKKRKKQKIIYALWITFFASRLIFSIDNESNPAYSASVGIRVGAAPYVTKYVTLIFSYIFQFARNPISKTFILAYNLPTILNIISNLFFRIGFSAYDYLAKNLFHLLSFLCSNHAYLSHIAKRIARKKLRPD
jgi:hypothetical protein